MSCVYTEHPTEPVIEIQVYSRVTQNDMDKILPQVEAFIAKHGTIRMVEVIEKFDGFDPGSLMDGLRFDMAHLKDVSHVAVVSDRGWIGMMTAAAAAVLPVTIRIFSMEELDAARDWVLNPD